MSGEGHLASAAPVHHRDCDWHADQYPWECNCGLIGPRAPWIGRDAEPRHLAPGLCARVWPNEPASVDDGHAYRNGDGTRRGNWMQTFTGRQFWPIDPRGDEVYIEDIAHGLANACRFAGQCERFYSVAEHSIYVSHLVPAEFALCGLLHDASEAYVVDIPRPLKPFIGGYKEIEARVWAAIAERFGLAVEMPPAIKAADNAVLLAEGNQIMKPHPAPWCVPGDPAAIKIWCWPPELAEQNFLSRFRELTGARS